MRDIFLISLRRAYISDDCITVYKQLGGIVIEFQAEPIFHQNHENMDKKMFWPVNQVLDMYSMAFHTVAKKVTKFIAIWHRIL